MSTPKHAKTWLALAVLALAGSDGWVRHAQAQPAPVVPPASVDAAAACPRPVRVCPAPSFNDTNASLNLKQVGNVCKFNPRQIEDLRLRQGGNVRWDFCSECAVDMDVQLDTVEADGPFGRFEVFWPQPQADNRVVERIGCYDLGNIRGDRARTGGRWKYSMRAKPSGTATLPDVIDPRLEIDNYLLREWLLHLLALMMGLFGGVWIGRRLRRQTA